VGTTDSHRRYGITETVAPPPPRHISALPLVVTAVLSLAFAGAAHAVSVDIVIPRTDPYEVRQYQRRYFEGVCHDARGKM